MLNNVKRAAGVRAVPLDNNLELHPWLGALAAIAPCGFSGI